MSQSGSAVCVGRVESIYRKFVHFLRLIILFDGFEEKIVRQSQQTNTILIYHFWALKKYTSMYIMATA